MNPKAVSPEMEPDGNPKPLVYVLGEAPDKQEDIEGKPFIGKYGSYLRENIPRWGLRETLFDNCVRTRPPDNRDPKREEIECFRSVVEESIEQAEPKLILGVGRIALTWMTGQKNVKAVRGKMFSVLVGEHLCWFMPVSHPSFILRIAKRREDKVPGKEWERVWKQDIERAYYFAEETEEVPDHMTPEEARKGVVLCHTLAEIEEALEALRKASAVGWDWETHGLRPYGKDARVLSGAFSDGSKTYAFGIDHDEAGWTKKERKRLIEMLRAFLVSGPIIIAHNLPFEMEWAAHLLGEDVLDTGRYGCSLQAAFVLDPGPPGMGAAGHSLDDLCLRYYGLALKSLSPAAAQITRLRELRLDRVLEYNALDAKLSVLLWNDKLMPQVVDEGLEESYRLQIERIPTIVMAQRLGVPIDQKVNHELMEQFTSEIITVSAKLQKRKEVKAYNDRFGEFNPASPQDVGRLLGDVLELPGVKTGPKRYSTGASLLEGFADESAIVRDILKMRSLAKLRGTYVERFRIDHPNSYVYSDGKIHSTFSIARTRTARLASEEPNAQNFSKRKHKEVRKQLKAPDGHSFVAVDQGQIEARVLAMESKDSEWIRMINDDYDVHQEWAEKIINIAPWFLEEKHKGNMKAARGTAKSFWVFAAFYGSSLASIVHNLDLPEGPAVELFEEFWDTFAGIKRWQQEKWNAYQREGCVWSLTGRRRLAPMSFNMAINTPIQGAASDICVDAMVRLHRRSVAEKAPWLQPVLQIHDDLTFIMPEQELEDGIAAVVEEQLAFKAPWLNVPLMVEVEVGPDLFSMESVGQFKSDGVLE